MQTENNNEELENQEDDIEIASIGDINVSQDDNSVFELKRQNEYSFHHHTKEVVYGVKNKNLS